MPDRGVRLQLLLGPNKLAPAPFGVVDALDALEVRNNDRQRDGFQLTFNLGRPVKQWDYPLLTLNNGLLDPPNRICIIVTIKSQATVLINGIITQHQVIPSNQPGQAKLQVTGEDTGLLFDLSDRRQVHTDQSDSDIVKIILGRYSGFVPKITETPDRPRSNQRVMPQRETDRAYIERLARRNSHIFFTEPTDKAGISLAYWGPKDRTDVKVQRALNMNMDWLTNVTQLSFNYDALRPVTPQVTIIDPVSKEPRPLPAPSPQPAPLARRRAAPLRERALSNTTGLSQQEAQRRAQAAADDGSEAASANGELDVVHYGDVLRSRRKVDVRGAGRLYDGTYYVKQVTHRIKRGEYKQSFNLTREGRESAHDRVSGGS